MANEKKTDSVEKTEKLVKIKIPRVRGEGDSVYYAYNDRDWLIQRGVEVEVPDYLADYIARQDEAKEAAYRRRMEIQNRTH